MTVLVMVINHSSSRWPLPSQPDLFPCYPYILSWGLGEVHVGAPCGGCRGVRLLSGLHLWLCRVGRLDGTLLKDCLLCASFLPWVSQSFWWQATETQAKHPSLNKRTLICLKAQLSSGPEGALSTLQLRLGHMPIPEPITGPGEAGL